MPSLRNILVYTQNSHLVVESRVEKDSLASHLILLSSQLSVCLINNAKPDTQSLAKVSWK